jgi:hypothetical protein
VWSTQGHCTPHPALSPRFEQAGAVVDFDLDGVFERGWRELRGKGLARGQRVEAGLGEVFRLISRPSVEYYGYFTDEDGVDQTALVGVGRSSATRVWQSGRRGAGC